MATDTLDKKHTDTGTDNGSWEGAEYPFKVGYGKLMIWYFLLSDAFTFAGFLIAYGTLRFSTVSWPVPDFVFSTFPFLGPHHPLLFVTFMTFVLLFSSFTMIRAVQEGHRENRKGVVIWMALTIVGGAGFLGCQAWEWTTLIGEEHMSVTTSPFGRHTEAGIYLDATGKESSETFEMGTSYLIHKASFESAKPAGGHESGEVNEGGHETPTGEASHAAEGTAESHGNGAEAHGGHSYAAPGDYPDAVVDERGYIHRKYLVASGTDSGVIKSEPFGPKAFGALFFFITGFHGFHVFSGVIFLTIIMINVISGIYVKRKNKNEMVEKIGLYWHFVDLVWVFVFLVFYLL
ncbi:MAG TPA: cytochrome c oxidase subunit 3 [Saprospiraceae bacterium]|nr:cytochrome c oxidase subunit 3 [Saprospiraceae bacterium]